MKSRQVSMYRFSNLMKWSRAVISSWTEISYRGSPSVSFYTDKMKHNTVHLSDVITDRRSELLSFSEYAFTG